MLKPMPAGAALLALLGVAATASATLNAGAPAIATAPVVAFGQQTFGDNSVSAKSTSIGGSAVWTEYWKLRLKSGDQVRIDWEGSGGAFISALAYAPSTNDFNLGTTSASFSADPGANGKSELRFTAKSSGLWPLALSSDTGFFADGAYREKPGAYDFIAYVMHVARLFVPAVSTIRAGSLLAVHVHAPDGTSVSDTDLIVHVYGRWNGGAHLLGHAATRAGLARVRLTVPRAIRGTRIIIWATANGANYLPAKSSSRNVDAR